MKYILPIQVIIADDHEVFRDGLVSMMAKVDELDCIAEAANGEDLLLLIERLKPDVALLDIKMPILDGLETTRIINEKFPEVNVIILSMIDDDITINEIIKAGAKGYLLKNAHKSQIIEAIKTVNKGHSFYCSNTIQLMSESMHRKIHHLPEPHELFTPKEKEIIIMICQEFTNRLIAGKLHISVRTVESHRRRIMEKMKVRTTVGLIHFAVRHHIYSWDKMDH